MGILHLPKSSKVQVWIAVPICSLGHARDLCDKFNPTVTYDVLPSFTITSTVSIAKYVCIRSCWIFHLSIFIPDRISGLSLSNACAEPRESRVTLSHGHPAMPHGIGIDHRCESCRERTGDGRKMDNTRGDMWRWCTHNPQMQKDRIRQVY